jgi:hypothetical protein
MRAGAGRTSARGRRDEAGRAKIKSAAEAALLKTRRLNSRAQRGCGTMRMYGFGVFQPSG